MVFVPPTWFEGLMIQAILYIVVPLLLATGIGVALGRMERDLGFGLGVLLIAFMALFMIALPVVSVYWHNSYEVPSVQEKIITVKEWQPRPGIMTGENGYMTISNADELLLITTEDEGFFNMENFLFQKFNTRDIFNDLKVGGTYKIKYYGWREGFTSGFPNILSIEEVIDEKNAKENSYKDYFGTKLAM